MEYRLVGTCSYYSNYVLQARSYLLYNEIIDVNEC